MVHNKIHRLKGYFIQLTSSEWEEVKSQIATSPPPSGGGKVRPPKTFTERGLYMFATILKSPKAVDTTLAIIETFAKVRELSRIINQVQSLPENSPKQKTLMELTGDLIIPDDKLEVKGTETTYEMNLAIFKIKRTIKKGT